MTKTPENADKYGIFQGFTFVIFTVQSSFQVQKLSKNYWDRMI